MAEPGSAQKRAPPVGVLTVVRNSTLRETLSKALSTEAGFRQVAAPAPPPRAPSLVWEHSPDLVVLASDGAGPECLQAIEEIMVAAPAPILVIGEGVEPGFAREAVERGALRVLSADDPLLADSRALAREAKLLAGVEVIVHLKGRRRPGAAACPPARPGVGPGRGAPRERIVAVASSAGGPQALASLLSALPASFPAPILVAQHIASGFEEGLVRWLQSACRLRVRAAAERELLASGTVYVGAPADRNLSVTRAGEFALTPVPPEQIYRPSGDLLFASVAELSGAGSIGVILSGMGSDGVEGLGKIRAAGGATIAQDEKSSLVFGMPRLAIERGYARKVLPLDAIAAELVRLVGEGKAG
ncbi:MAG: chemotaxis protein CheB [Deltaproteobacteria bacterium]|nr:chemotaxis protein CheB [Deltaproteobacteria bacterium]